MYINLAALITGIAYTVVILVALYVLCLPINLLCEWEDKRRWRKALQKFHREGSSGVEETEARAA